MDTPPHRLGLERAVEVYSGHDALVGVTGSGYVLGPDLVLTSEAVVDPGTPCQVRAPWTARWAAAESVWRGRGAVLLRVPDAPWAHLPGVEHTRWARVSCDERLPQVRCVARGFPRAGHRAGFRDAESVAGVVNVPAGAVSRTLTVSVPGPDPAPQPDRAAGPDTSSPERVLSPGASLPQRVLDPDDASLPGSLWQGLPGAALLAEPAGQIIGVISGPGLTAVPVTVLLRDERFRELVGVPSLEVVAEDGPSVDLAGLLVPARDGLPPDCADWVALVARHAVVPFLGREEELAKLRSWAADPATLSIAILTGRGGTGKTRLAGELCAELAETGWDTGFLPTESLCGPLSDPDASIDAPRPALVVVDRPEPSSPLLGELIRRLAKHGRNPRLRLLLLVREPGDPEWWRRLDTAAGGWLRRLNTTTVQLNTAPLTLSERTEHAFAAMKAFAPTRTALPAPPRLDDPDYGLPLHVHVAALLRLRDDEPQDWAMGAGPLERFVTREYAQWTQTWHTTNAQADRTSPDQRLGKRVWPEEPAQPEEPERPKDPEQPKTPAQHQEPARQTELKRHAEPVWRRGPVREDPRGWPEEAVLGDQRAGPGVMAWQAVAVVTLTAPAPAELPALLTAVPGIRSRAEIAPDVATWLTRIFPGGKRLTPLGPALVAEQFLAGTEDLDALVLALHDHESCTAEHLIHLLDVLRLSAGRERARSALWSLLASRLEKLVARAAANPGTRLADVLDAALSLFTPDRQLAEAASSAVTKATSSRAASKAEIKPTSEAATRATSHPADRAWRGGEIGLRALRVTLGDLTVRHRRTSGERTALAAALAWSSDGLAAVGRVGEAVVTAAEAVEIYAAAPPYEDAAGRARALFGLGACLLIAGEADGALKPAQEAAARFRILAEEDHGYANEAARAHHNVACALLETGRLGESVRAFEAAGGDTTFATYITDLLSVLPRTPPPHPSAPAKAPPTPFRIQRPGPVTTAFAPRTTENRPPPPPARTSEAAVTLVAIPAPLGPAEETDAETRAELAGCLAIAVTTAVAHTAPTSGDIAHRLYELAAWLETHDRHADALVPATEAVVRLRGLAGEEPGLRAMLADAAALLSRLHARLEDLDAARRSATEAVRSLRALVTLDPDDHRPALAGQLLHLGELLLLDDRPDVAPAPLQEALAVAPEGHTAAQAAGRRLLGLCLDELGRTADARVQLELAAELYDVLGPESATYRRHHAEIRTKLHDREEVPPAEGRPWLLAMVVVRPEEAVARAQARLAECGKGVGSGGGLTRAQIDAYLSAQATLAGAWADAGRAVEGLALGTQAAETLQRHAAPDGRPHALAVGMVAAALGRSLVGLGRHKEAIPHLLTAIESYGPHSGTGLVVRTELAELLILETVSLFRAACPADAEAAADHLVELYASLVAERLETPLALAGALRLQAEIRLTRHNPQAALHAVTRALDLLPKDPEQPEEPEEPERPAEHEDTRLLTATCLELAGLCLTELHQSATAKENLAVGTALMATLDRPIPHDLVSTHLLALVRLARDQDPAAGVTLYAQILDMRPLPGTDVLEAVVAELDAYVDRLGAAAAELVPSLTAFTEAMEREVPLSGVPETYDRYGRCLAHFSQAATRVGDTRTAVAGADLAVRVYRGLAAVSSAYREPLGLALAALTRLRRADPAELEQAIDLLSGHQHPVRLAETLHLYAVELLEHGRPVEALAQCERAADLCDELDDPAVNAAVYAQLGSTLAALERHQAALEAITWSLAELDRGGDVPRVRAQAIQVRGRVLRAFGREREALAHLVEALRLFTGLPDPPAAAETAAMIADDLLAAGRPQEAAEYAGIAMIGQSPGTIKHALATQRLIRCHMMRGALAEANALVEGLIPLARRSPDDLTYRAVLADSLAQSSELLPLLRLDGGAQAESRAREAIAIYDDLLTTGMDAQALHTSRAGACLTLAAALRMRDLAAEAIQPLREAVAALERFSPGIPMQAGLLSRAMLMLGDALMEAGRALEAGLVFHRGTQITRDELSRAVAHARLGFCQRELGRADAADAALRVSSTLLRDLLAAEPDAEPAADLTALLRDVLRGRVNVLEQAGRTDDAQAVEAELRRLPTPS